MAVKYIKDHKTQETVYPITKSDCIIDAHSISNVEIDLLFDDSVNNSAVQDSGMDYLNYNGLKHYHKKILEGVKTDIENAQVDLTGYATEQWVENKGYLTEHQDISGKVDVIDFEEATLVTSAALNKLHQNLLWNSEQVYVRCDKTKTREEALVGDSSIVYFTDDTNEIIVNGQSYGKLGGGYLPLSGGTVTGNFGVSNLFTVSTLGDDIPIILGDQSNKAVRIAYNTLYDSELDIINNPHLIIGPSNSAALFLNRSGVQAVHTDNTIASTLHLNPQGGLVKFGGGIETLQDITTASINLLGTTSNVLKYTDINLLLYDLINSHICLGENIENSITDIITLSANNVNVYKNMSVGGDINAAAFYETSDARKKDVKSDLSLDKCYDLIDKCQTVIYSLKDQTKEQVGMIAQEIEEFFPEVVATDEEGFKSLAYDRLVVICFKVLKDIIKRLNHIENIL